jgi:hypothetical protein
MGERSVNTFKDDFKWQSKYINDVKAILKSQAMKIVNVEVATPEEDMKHATDFKIKITAGDVAVRIRRDNCRYRDLTIRAYNKGYKTEIHKLREGYGDWYLYAWTSGNSISEWMLIDLNVMRNNDCFSEDRPIRMNKDGNTGFISYPLSELKDIKAIVAGKIRKPV